MVHAEIPDVHQARLLGNRQVSGWGSPSGLHQAPNSAVKKPPFIAESHTHGLVIGVASKTVDISSSSWDFLHVVQGGLTLWLLRRGRACVSSVCEATNGCSDSSEGAG